MAARDSSYTNRSSRCTYDGGLELYYCGFFFMLRYEYVVPICAAVFRTTRGFIIVVLITVVFRHWTTRFKCHWTSCVRVLLNNSTYSSSIGVYIFGPHKTCLIRLLLRFARRAGTIIRNFWRLRGIFQYVRTTNVSGSRGITYRSHFYRTTSVRIYS